MKLMIERLNSAFAFALLVMIALIMSAPVVQASPGWMEAPQAVGTFMRPGKIDKSTMQVTPRVNPLSAAIGMINSTSTDPTDTLSVKASSGSAASAAPCTEAHRTLILVSLQRIPDH